jgi:predicted 3-demethylubiquinone-9 3-methyltransferase (glyoxalase superfamily)
MSSKVTPFLWFDTHAEAAMRFYTSIFENSRIVSIQYYPEGFEEGPMHGMEGRVLHGEFELAGERFFALDGGQVFSFTPAISFFVNCASEAECETLWARLADGGTVLMPLEAHSFSAKFGWVADKYGLSWQLSVGTGPQKITPFLMFTGEQYGRAEEAVRFYTSLFKNAGIVHLKHHDAAANGQAHTVEWAAFHLDNRAFMASENNAEHSFGFSGAVSFYVNCDSQAEVDHFWQALSAVPEAEQCGWLQDRYGIMWQIIPEAMGALLSDPDAEKSGRAMAAMLEMKKIDVAALERAYAGA